MSNCRNIRFTEAEEFDSQPIVFKFFAVLAESVIFDTPVLIFTPMQGISELQLVIHLWNASVGIRDAVK